MARNPVAKTRSDLTVKCFSAEQGKCLQLKKIFFLENPVLKLTSCMNIPLCLKTLIFLISKHMILETGLWIICTLDPVLNDI